MIAGLLHKWIWPGRHEWDEFAMCKRRCRLCGLEQWVFTNSYPEIGEPESEWRDMTLPEPSRKVLRAIRRAAKSNAP